MKEANKNIQERKQVILEMMKHPQYVPMKIKEMIMMLQIPASDRDELEDILGELISEGKVFRTKRGKFAIPQAYNLVAGTFQGHPKGYGFLISLIRILHRKNKENERL